MIRNARFVSLATWSALFIAANTSWAGSPTTSNSPSRDVALFFASTHDIERGPNGRALPTDRDLGLVVGKAGVSIPNASHAVSGTDSTKVDALLSTTSVVNVVAGSLDRMALPAFLGAVDAKLEASAVFGRHLIVLVHGFNTEFEYAIRRAGQLTHDMRFDGVMIAFNWISQARLLDYMADLNEAQLGADRLSDFLSILANSVKADKINLIAHSMGTHVVLGAVERYLLSTTTTADAMKLQQGEIILAAPHISEATFSRYNREMEGRVRITVYTSNVDLALKTTICDNDRPCMGYYSGKAPTLAEGVDVIDVSAAGIRFAINHNIPFESALVRRSKNSKNYFSRRRCGGIDAPNR